MHQYRIQLSARLKMFISGLHPQIKKRVRAGLEDIVQNPLVGKALKDELDGLFSYRLGRLRLIYKVTNQVVAVIAIGPRKQIYQDTLQLIKKTS